MASLTQTSIVARRIIRYGVYLIILLIIIRFAYQGGLTIYRKFFPPSPPPPTVPFKELVKLPFPEKDRPENLSFNLETPEGGLPKLPPQAEVYFMPPPQTNIQALEAGKGLAQRLGFDPEGRLILENVPNVYIFNKENVPSTLTMNIVTGVFSIGYDINSDPSVIENIPPDPEDATQNVKSYLGGAGLLTDDLKIGTTTHEFLKIEGGNLVSAISLSEADVIKINLFRKNLGGNPGYPSVTAQMPEANTWFILSGGQKKQIIAAEYHYYPIDETKKGTYPIKTSEVAWEELKTGGGFIVNLGNNPEGKITVRRVYLAYYDPGQSTSYYQPVVVFEGDNDFLAYIPAVTEEFYPK